MTDLLDRLGQALAGRYALERELGRGGMATVYLARDVRHDRPVAIKVLAPDLAAVIGSERFLREIRLTAGLRHPHVLPVLDSGDADGLLYYVMPYVEGESLRDRLLRETQLPVSEALAIAREVADALSYAHGRGVIHRDIKPENILLEAGHAVVADFGIARAVSAAGGDRLTQTGLAIGTPAYMSPEQASAEPVDARSDVYSLSCVVYEMLAGSPPFAAPTAHAVLARRLTEQPPDVTAARRAVPAPVARAIATGLAPLPADRFSDARHFAEALSAATGPASGQARADRRPGGWQKVAFAVVAVAVVAAGALLVARRRPDGAGDSEPLLRRSITQVTAGAGLEQWPSWYPDGARLVYSAEVDGFLRLVERAPDTGVERPLTGGARDDIQATVAPGGGQVAFVRSNLPGGRLQPSDVLGWYGEGGDIWVLDPATGVETLLVRDAFNPAYSPDGARVAFDAEFAGPRRIWTTDARGRNPQQVTTDSSEAVVHTSPAWSPDGARLAFRLIENTKSDIAVIDLATRAVVRITDDNVIDLDPVWSAAGDALYYCSSGGGGVNLWRVRMTPGGGPAGPAEQLTTGAGNDLQPAVAPGSGRVAFTILAINSDLWRLPVSPATGQPTGEPEAMVATTREDSRGAWAPDGRLVAFNSDRQGDMNIWVHDVATGTDRQLTRGPGGDYQPAWSPDGARIAFFSARAGTNDIWTVDVATGALTALTSSPAMETNPVFSPDGRRVAYQSDQTGRLEVWVVESDGSGARQLTTVGAGGHFMRWSDDGRFVFVRSDAGTPERPVLRVDVASGAVEPALPGGSHLSFSPDRSLVLDVTGHKVLWVYPANGGPRRRVFEFADADSRIDYPVWSPDGRWILFDRGTPRGGDVWVMEESR
ncbi:MAG TPA: protein kinase [Gemmatimonadales bacterium]|nr:protein kinase [Gemmatimonadales bacterium]